MDNKGETIFQRFKNLFTGGYTVKRDTEIEYDRQYIPQLDEILGEYSEVTLAIINDIVNQAAQSDINVKYKGKDAEDSHIYKLLKYNPTTSDTFVVFFASLVASYLLYGEAFARIHRSDDKLGSKNILRLELLDQSDLVMGMYTNNGERYYTVKSTNERIPDYNVIHIQNFTLDGLTGFDLVKRLEVTKGLEGNLNAAIKRVITKRELEMYVETTKDYNTDEREKQAIHEMAVINKMLKPFNHGENIPLITKKDYKINTVDSKGSKDLNIDTIQKIVEDRVALMFNYPLARFSRSADGLMETQYMLQKQTIEPILKRFEQEFTKKLLTFKEINDGYSIVFDRLGQTYELKEKSTSIVNLVRSSVLSSDEGRKMLGLDEIGGNMSEFYRSADLVSINDINNDNSTKNNERNVENDDDG